MPLSDGKKQDYLATTRQLAFKKSVDICNCFGHDKKKCKKEIVDNLLNPKQEVWFAPFTRTMERFITLSNDGVMLYDYYFSPRTQKNQLKKAMEADKQRVIFAKLRDYKRDDKFRFIGVFIVDKMKSSMENGIVYKKVAEKVLIEK